MPYPMTRIIIPSDADGLWSEPDDHNLGPPSPPYSPHTIGSERILEASSPLSSLGSSFGSMNDVDPLWSPSACFLYRSNLVDISLGRRVWGLRQPVYGFNGLVEGAIKLSRKCTHVVRLEVSVERALFICQGQVQLTNVFRFSAPGENQGDCLKQRNAC